MSFEAGKFVEEFEQAPTIEKINELKKPELLQVGKHYELSVKTAMRKAKIKRILVEHMVSEDMLDPAVLEGLDDDDKDVLEVRKLELEYQLKLEEMKREREHEEREKEKEREEREREWKLRQEQFENERQLREEDRV